MIELILTIPIKSYNRIYLNLMNVEKNFADEKLFLNIENHKNNTFNPNDIITFNEKKDTLKKYDAKNKNSKKVRIDIEKIDFPIIIFVIIIIFFFGNNWIIYSFTFRNWIT